MRSQSVGQFLDHLAARTPVPGGGAVAALHAALAAALLGMAGRHSDGRQYAAHEPVIVRVRDQADAARAEALRLAERDAEAFQALAEAYRLPSRTPPEQRTRAGAIATALAGAAEPAAAVVALADQLVALAEELAPVANPNLLTDVAAAAESARAAASTARVNVEVNLAGVDDDPLRVRLATQVAIVDTIAARAHRLMAEVRNRIYG